MPTRSDFRERRAQRKRRDRLIYALIIGGVILLVAFVVLLPTLAPVGDITLPQASVYPSPDDHALGDPKAPVVIEEFSDFQCPFCKRFHDETFAQLVENYVATGKVYFVYRHFPVVDRNDPAQESHAAATAAICAGRQNHFWDYQDVLFANQNGENIGDFSQRRLEAMAEKIGLDMQAFRACYGSQDARAALAADALLATKNGLTSTPSFLINGKLFLGAQPYEAFQKVIEAEIGGS
jgi:protein-disulfide isomerase